MAWTYDNLRTAYHDKIMGENDLMQIIMELQAQVSAVKVVYGRLMNYRHNNTLNFQLEKLDDYLRELNDALEGGE